MRIGVVFPQTDLGGDAGAVRAYGEAVEALGYRHILAYDHVVGADPAVHTGWAGPYDVHTTFHEPFVMFGYLAAVTRTVELVTGVIILPQRQSTLVAKQAAEVDLLSDGRLRLGVGVGWNPVEYEALGENFTDRGKRSEEQIALLRRLWTEQTVSFAGKFHRVTGAGLAPLPIQRPIPVWLGTASAPGFRRAGRIADGWFPMTRPGRKLDHALALVAEGAAAAGRDPAEIGMEGQVKWSGDDDAVRREIDAWAQAGASHVSVNTMGAGLSTVDDHLAVLTRLAAGS
ncbi:LLM class F420-dependent oxidoreductase [Mycobacterium sp. 852013-51886_SCH5428379]|uniref:LLM class F420-dependent oxidoreductase n=1 Tax=Mycobacterium sp. 852013-51886_SCH5428379 TaxID=1834111 RepID=UPI0007FCE536|nr:LLM class F420-dependent oxidoreductase [Mycobacterium sp. 852013-51886_SCH5428379]OBB57853.1 LLM class F420-dependent oxidoreductase [Mycobacterium sp. 852013-51886_SCH5428379]